MPRFVYGPRSDAPARGTVPPVTKADPAVTMEFSPDLHAFAVALPAFDVEQFSQILRVSVAFVPPGVSVPDDARTLYEDAGVAKVGAVPGPAGEAAVLTFPVPEQFDLTGCGAQVILELQD